MVCCAIILLPEESLLFAQGTTPATPPPAPTATTEPAEAKLPAEKLDSLVAPIALYPDTLLAQALVASTYPLEIVQLQQWLVKNKDLKDTALTDAAAKQPWDPAIQAMAAIPDLVKRLADDIQWTTELGNAFLAQQSDVMDAVQRMRKKATDKGALVSNEQQKVETQVIEEKTVIVVQSANPEVIYVPSYNPTVVYGPPPVYYSYPPVYYPPPGYAFMSFSIGVAVGAAFWGGGCGWGSNDINIDIDRNTNINGGDRNNINTGDRGNGGNRANSTNRGSGSGGKSSWSHNPQHRGAAPYSNKSTASKFSGSTRAQSGGSSRVNATQQSLGASSRSAGAGTGASRAGGAGASATSRSTGAGGGGGRSPSSSGYNVGSRDMPSSSASRSSGFGGGSSGFNSSSARANSSRGASSMGGRGGGGGGRRR